MATTLYITGVPGCPVFSFVYSAMVENLNTLGIEKGVKHEWDEFCGFIRFDFADEYKELAKALLELNPFFLSTSELKGDDLEKYCHTVWKMPMEQIKFNPLVMA